MQSLCNAKHLFLSGALALAVSSALASTTTTLTVTAAGSPVTATTNGTVITLTAAVLNGATPVKAGTVNFCDAAAKYCADIHVLATAQLTSAGTAIVRFVPAVGTHSYNAVFAGTNTNAGSVSATASLKVTQSGLVPTKPGIAQSGTASGYTLTSQVGGIGSAPLTGTVSFLDTSRGSAVLGKASLSGAVSGLSFLNSSSFSYDLDGMATGDFNGDGFADLALIVGEPSTLLVELGNGEGTFRPIKVAAPVNVTYSALAAGDFNGDGHTDLAIGTQSGVVILLGNGDGTFNAITANAITLAGPIQIVVADFNGDGILDLAAINLTDPIVALAQGNGDGTFTALTSLSITNPSVMATADFNGDGKADLAIATTYGGPMAVMLGNGNGTFTTAPNGITACYTCNTMAVADFNDDGKPDMALSDYANGGLTELIGNGDGSFTPAPTPLPSIGQGAYSVYTGDFNGDGKADLVVSLEVDSSEVSILLGDGDGTFSVPPLAPYTIGDGVPSSIAVADFNGDGLADFALANAGPSTSAVFVAATQTASTTVTGIVVPASSGTDAIVAAYSGDTNYSSSVSIPADLDGRTVSVSPTSLSFPATYAGDTAGYQTISITNTSNANLDISSIAVTNTGDFYSFGIREQTCGASLSAAATCNFRVAFRPTNTKSANLMTATISVFDNAFGSPQQVSMTGTVYGVPGLSISPSSLTFPATYVGQTAAYQRVLLTNVSGADLVVTSIAVTNTTSFYSWGIREASCDVLAAGDVCTFLVAFRPTSVGPMTADITLDYRSRGSPQKITLSGTGK